LGRFEKMTRHHHKIYLFAKPPDGLCAGDAVDSLQGNPTALEHNGMQPVMKRKKFFHFRTGGLERLQGVDQQLLQ